MSDQADALALFVLCSHILIPAARSSKQHADEFGASEDIDCAKDDNDASKPVGFFADSVRKRDKLWSTLPHHRFTVLRLRFWSLIFSIRASDIDLQCHPRASSAATAGHSTAQLKPCGYSPNTNDCLPTLTDLLLFSPIASLTFQISTHY